MVIFISNLTMGDMGMDFWIRFGLDFLDRIPQFFLNPVLYIVLLLLMMQFRREVLLQRRLFNVRVTSVFKEMSYSLSKGIIGGLLLTIVLLAFGASFTYKELLLLEGIIVLMAFINLRYLHIGYGAGVLLLLSSVADGLPDLSTGGWVQNLQETLRDIQPLSLAVLAGAIFVVEGVLLGKSDNREGLFPIMVDGKRGRAVGAYEIRRFWFFPLMLFVTGGTGMDHTIPERVDWWPWLSGSVFALGLFPFPGVAGFVDSVKTGLPDGKIAHGQRGLWIAGIGTLLLSLLIPLWSPIVPVIAVVILVAHAVIRWTGRRLERGKPFYFGRLPQGVRVMSVVPGSPGADMGIVAGDVLLKVNGQKVSEHGEVYPLLQRQTAFCKMEVLNEDGNIKYVHRSMYQGEPHDLGIVPAPDQNSLYYVKEGSLNLLGLFSLGIRRIDERPINLEYGQGKDVSM